jgi:hypothetical protein
MNSNISLLSAANQTDMAEVDAAARKFLKIRLRLFFKNLKRLALKIV